MARYEALEQAKDHSRHSGARSATKLATSVATVTIASATKLHGDLRILTSLGPLQKFSNGFSCHVPLSVVFSKGPLQKDLILVIYYHDFR